MAAPPPSWVILLRTISRAPHDQHPDVSIAPAAPPFLSHLTVSPRASAHPLAGSPRVLAADLPNGLFLTATLPPSNAAYLLVLDAASGTAHRVPGPAHRLSPTGLDSTSLGVISAPNGAGGFMVVGFQYQVGDPMSRLHCYSSRTGRWASQDVNNPRRHRTWYFSNVIAHDGRLWWVDTTATLCCDPFADNPNMAFVRLPDHVSDSDSDDDEGGDGDDHVSDSDDVDATFAGDDSDTSDRTHGFCSYCADIPLGSRRCVQVVNGKLRWIQMLCGHMDECRDGAPSFTMLTLDDPAPVHFGWDLEVNLHDCFSFAKIWESVSYKETGLREEEPVLALIHPRSPFIVYFLLDGHLFGVNMITKELAGCEPHGMAEQDVSVSSLLAWELPPALAAAGAASAGAAAGSPPAPARAVSEKKGGVN